MSSEKRVYKIYVGNIDEKDVKKFMDDVVSKFKNKTVMEPGIVYAPYVPMNINALIEAYVPKQKILKVKEWLRFQQYGKKTINNKFYGTLGSPEIPEIDLKIESRTVETEEWKIVDGVAINKKNKALKLTEEEFEFNKISEELKKRGI